MKILIVGSGGREHAIAWKVSQSEKADKIYCAPGNAGIAEYAECVDIGAMEFDKLAAFAKEHAIDLTIIGMDDPLVGGIVDVFEAEGLRVFGPRKNAAILEGSKAFSKDLMKKYNIPTAGYENFDDPEKALLYLKTAEMPIVLKADGLALGKGVLICNTHEEAEAGVKEIMMDKKFGSAGNQMVDAMKAEGRTFKGIIFFGLMLTEKGPRVLEYNARFGDPETQVVLPLIKNDIVDVFEACVDGTLDQIELEFEDNAAVCVVLASDGYPVKYEKGFKIKGLENFKEKDGYYVFHAGSKFDADGNIVTNGGRVLGVTATGKDLKAARANAYQATEWIEFDNKYMRHDIGKAIDEA